MFLTKDDLSANLYPEVAQTMSRYTDALFAMNFSSAEGEIEMYLSGRYLIRPELDKTGDARHRYLLSIARDLAIYHLYSLQENIPAHRVKRYEQAIAMLKLIQDGKSTLPGVALVPVPDDPGQTGQVNFGSNTARVSLVDAFGGYSDTRPPIPSSNGYV